MVMTKSVLTGVPKGRGAISNEVSRFDPLKREVFDDGWGGTREDLLPLRTEVQIERPRTLITYNKSPDLPFDRSINPYRGCEHGCVYCFARPTHAYLGLSPGLDFETRLIARPDAADVLKRELAHKRYMVDTIAVGTNTDPYQPIEKDFRIMLDCLEVLAACRHPVAIVTKGSLIERDIDILAEMARRGLVAVGISVTTLDRDLGRSLEPRAPTPVRRLKMISALTDAGIPVRVMASPIFPGLTDTELEPILEAGRDAGAMTASWSMLRLPREVSPLVQEWLWQHVPGRAAKIMARLREMHGGKDYDARWGHRMRGEGPYAEMIAHRFALAVKRLGFVDRLPTLQNHHFRPPADLDGQMSLF